MRHKKFLLKKINRIKKIKYDKKAFLSPVNNITKAKKGNKT